MPFPFTMEASLRDIVLAVRRREEDGKSEILIVLCCENAKGMQMISSSKNVGPSPFLSCAERQWLMFTLAQAETCDA